MSEDIIENKLLIGKIKEEVIALFGNNYFSENKDHLGYELEFVSVLINIDVNILSIFFENGKI